MKPDDDPWCELDGYAEPSLTPGFARRVLYLAGTQRRRRQVRNRLAALCALCGALGFGATAIIRTRPPHTNVPPGMNHNHGAPGAVVQRSGALAENTGRRTVEVFSVRRRMEGNSGGDDASAIEAARKSRQFETTGSYESQTLVIEAPPRSSAGAAIAADETTSARGARTSVPQRPEQSSAEIGAAIKQPLIHVP